MVPIKRSLAKQDNRMPRAKAVASAVLAIYADYPAGPERDAALAAMVPDVDARAKAPAARIGTSDDAPEAGMTDDLSGIPPAIAFTVFASKFARDQRGGAKPRHSPRWPRSSAAVTHRTSPRCRGSSSPGSPTSQTRTARAARRACATMPGWNGSAVWRATTTPSRRPMAALWRSRKPPS